MRRSMTKESRQPPGTNVSEDPENRMEDPQKKNLKIWTDYWNQSMQNADRMTEDCQAEFWNKRSADFAKKFDKKNGRKETGETLGFLEESGISINGARILDIGCGPGSLSLPLARAGADVTSLDISSGMLERLVEIAENEGLSIKPVECSWWSADIDKLHLRNQFDLVIASNTPAVRDPETLDRMMNCSRQYCYYSHMINRGGDLMGQDFISTIVKMGPWPQSMGLLHPFMYLYIVGYRPIIRFRKSPWREKVDRTEATERAMNLLGSNDITFDLLEKEIQKFYKKNAKDGILNSSSEVYSGMMIWRINH